MSTGLYSGSSGLSGSTGLNTGVVGLYGGAPGLLTDFGNTYSPTATAYFDAMTTPPDASWKSAANTLINSLTSAGVWAKLDWISLPAPAEQGFRVNAVTPSQVMTAVNSPTYTANKGFTGDGATSYLNTGWNATTAVSPKYTQNSAELGVWVGTDATGTYYDAGVTSAYLASRTSAGGAWGGNAISSTFSNSTGPTTAIGHKMWTRETSTTGNYWVNGAVSAAISTTTTTPRNAAFFVCAMNNSSTGGSTPINYSPRRVQAVHWGSQLSSTEVAALYSALNTFMTAVGAV